jgi:LytS/YehU family sensor histidine kinase
MRYLLHESNHSLVPLTKEIEYMENYISLEKLRFNDEIPIEFDIIGNIEGVRIAPLIFFTFLENAFKHGVSTSSKDTWMKISLEVRDKTLLYHVSNSKVSDTSKTVTDRSGIGLQNVNRRLDLAYPDRYDLVIEDKEKSYSVDLKILL